MDPICLSLNTLYHTNKAIENYRYCENCYDDVQLPAVLIKNTMTKAI